MTDHKNDHPLPESGDASTVSRRDLLVGGAAIASTVTVGCSVEDEQALELRHAECEGGTALSAEQLLAPVKRIVCLMMENRSFDHYFGSLSLLEGRDDVDGLVGGESNPGPDGSATEIFHLDQHQKLHHLPHTWEAMHAGFNNGKMDGFAMAHHDANKAESLTAFREVMGFYTREDIPVMYALADNYTLCERWFCSVMGPTWPNRFFLHAASSGGRKTNKPRPFLTSIWDKLDDADLRGLNYFSDLPWAAAAMFKVSGFRGLSSFFKHAERGELPEFSVIDPGFFFSTSDHPREVGGDSDHPEMGPNTSLGQLLISTLYTALANSPQWNETMFIITYDESGGFYDHVVPPKTVDERGDFTQLGFRVPGLVIGPHVRAGCINSNQFEHSSVIKTATTRFGLEPINDRVIASNDLSSCIHPDLIGKPRAPIQLPKITIDEDSLIQKLRMVNTQPELAAAADSGQIPAELDLRPYQEREVRDLIRLARDFDLVTSGGFTTRPR